MIVEDQAEWKDKVFVSEPYSQLPPLATTSCTIEDRGKHTHTHTHHLHQYYSHRYQLLYSLHHLMQLKEIKMPQTSLQPLLWMEIHNVHPRSPFKLQEMRVRSPSAPPRTAYPVKVKWPCSAGCPWVLWSPLWRSQMLERS